ncbi:hypothetical protein PG994_006552, partial [Apiospora phragmitis]
ASRGHEVSQQIAPPLQRFSIRTPGSEELAQQVEIHLAPYAEGKFKLVCGGRFTIGPRAGQPCVAKTFKARHGSFDEQLAGEYRVIRCAQALVEAWNNAGVVQQPVCVLAPQVMTSDDGTKERRMVEPFIPGYRKHNNNNGYVMPSFDPWNEVMQAVSHFSYHISDGARLLCDVQGGPAKNVYVLTDPAVHSDGNHYGETDLGKPGMQRFFATHRCNKFCRSDWKKPVPVSK